MSKTKHTPGPWKIVETNLYPNLEIVDSLFGVPIALSSRPRGSGIRKCDRANARLIAAAPKLLEALVILMREIHYLVEEGTLPSEANNHPSMLKARVAIDEAEGGENE